MRHAREFDARADQAAQAVRRESDLLARRARHERLRAEGARAGRGRQPAYFMPFQYANAANPRAHYEGTGAEIAEALDRVDVFVAGLGTGGTLMGTGERLRESFPDVVVAAAEPMPGDPVMGLRSLEDGYTPPILDVSKLDRKVLVSNAEARRGRARAAAARGPLHRRLVRRGRPRRATLAAELDEGVVVCVLADGGWKYISASFWDDADRRRRSTARSGGSSRSRAARARGARARRGAERACGLIAFRDGAAERYLPGRNALASPYRFQLEPGDPARLLPRGRGLRARRLPLAPRDRGAAVADGRRQHRPVGASSVPDPLARARRAARVADRGRRGARGAAGRGLIDRGA